MLEPRWGAVRRSGGAGLVDAVDTKPLLIARLGGWVLVSWNGESSHADSLILVIAQLSTT